MTSPEKKLDSLDLETGIPEIHSSEQRDDAYPGWVIKGVRDSLDQAKQGNLIAYTDIKAMLDLK
ncbi:hypothetical protein GCM10023149_50910 [Mucilaginibacter gynuensis]|uniref:Uncharacterized protein n=1 Tax=Mucilaginibacter gynuensis TaxID=1302236 RepID=A0ABP8HIS2_9SPHI